MTLALQSIAVPDLSRCEHPVADLQETHGTSGRSSLMYSRFFGQDCVFLQNHDHCGMLLGAVRAAVQRQPDLRQRVGLGVYVKTQTHNTVAGDPWLRGIFDTAGLESWDVMTLSMTNCASALAAVHMFAALDEPVLILAGEKAFHPAGCRLSVGLLGEAPIAALFLPVDDCSDGRAVSASSVRHLPRFFSNPDDMDIEDRRLLQSQFESGFAEFLTEFAREHCHFMARQPVVIPYNLNTPLMLRVLTACGLDANIAAGYSGRTGHAFCSDPFLNLATLSVPDDAPVLLICAGMGVTFAALALEPATGRIHPEHDAQQGDLQ